MEGQWFRAGWLWAKLALVALMAAGYAYLIRLLNELVTVGLIGIVILVVVKPF